MAHATVLALMDREGDFELAEEWIKRWRGRMLVCPEEPEGSLCCVASWNVDAPQDALDELPQHMLAGSDCASGHDEHQ